jgi:hypothetical protein
MEKKEITPTPKKKKSVWLFIAIAIIVILIFAVKGNYNEINNYLNPPLTTHVSEPANIELYKFDALSSNTSMTTEIWLINIGEKTATNITVFIRARNQTGSILFERNISLTSFVLRGNETCTGIYGISYTKDTKEIFSTIEIKWDSGRHSYQKEIQMG